MAGCERYHAHHVPDSDLVADLYLEAIDFLDGVGVPQYEISNFAGPGSESRHNLKYWTRQPYLGFGVDAHSMLASGDEKMDAVRFATTDVLEKYVAGSPLQGSEISPATALEESFFLGLRLNRGIDLHAIARRFGPQVVEDLRPTIAELVEIGLLQPAADRIRLTARGRLLSNE